MNGRLGWPELASRALPAVLQGAPKNSHTINDLFPPNKAKNVPDAFYDCVTQSFTALCSSLHSFLSLRSVPTFLM